MFDRFLIAPDSLANDIDASGQVTGFHMAVRHANYRGCFLSLHNGYYLRVDGNEFDREQQTFEINGKPARTFEEIKTAVWEHWDFDDAGVLHVALPGGLAPGTHTIDFQQSVLAAYGYHSTDEEWVLKPPRPGFGAGSDKTPTIMTYELTLSETGA